MEKLGFQKLGVSHKAATRCLDGAKLDRHEYILTSPEIEHICSFGARFRSWAFRFNLSANRFNFG